MERSNQIQVKLVDAIAGWSVVGDNGKAWVENNEIVKPTTNQLLLAEFDGLDFFLKNSTIVVSSFMSQ